MLMLLLLKVILGLGILLSIYALHVERNLKKKSYQAACDFSERVSCSKAFSSPYGHLFGLSNAFFGLLFYFGMYALLLFHLQFLFFMGAFCSVFGSFYLAYLSYVKLKTFCLVCTSIYLVNILLLILSTLLLF